MIHQLPLELLYQVLSHVSYSEFNVLYKVLPPTLVDIALKLKLKQNYILHEESLFKLVSTNCLEFVNASYIPKIPTVKTDPGPLARYRQNRSTRLERSNESSIPLFFKHMDLDQRLIWLTPEFLSTQYYFEVLGFYVSHGRLLLRENYNKCWYRQKVLGSLCDIRNYWVSSQTGNPQDIVPITVESVQQQQQQGKEKEDTAGKKQDTRTRIGQSALSGTDLAGTVILDAYCTMTLEKRGRCDDDISSTIIERPLFPPRPSLPWNYADQLPVGYPTTRTWPTDGTANSGYFVVEQLAITIPEFLDLLVV